MSKIDDGHVQIVTPKRTYTLKPTLNAIRGISRHFGTLDEAARLVRARSWDAVRTIVVHGAALEGKAAKGVDDDIFEAGLLEVVAPCVEYLFVLQNGGRPLRDVGDDEADEAGDDSGNPLDG